MSDPIREIDLRRLQVLEEQAARTGIHTAAEVTIEIRDLRAKYGLPDVASNPMLERSSAMIERQLRMVLEEVKIVVVAGRSLAERLTRLEDHYADDRASRKERRNDQDEAWEKFRTELQRHWNALLLLASVVLFGFVLIGLAFLVRN